MQSASGYKIRIAENNRKIASVFIYTLDLYRAVVDFFIALVLRHWVSLIGFNKMSCNFSKEKDCAASCCFTHC